MNKKKKKYFIGGAIFLTTPTLFAISCSQTRNLNQEKLDRITEDMVKVALNIKPDSSILPSDVNFTTMNKKVSLNGLNNVNVEIKKVQAQDFYGQLDVTVAVSWESLTYSGNPFTITWNGFQTTTQHDQALMNGINVENLKKGIEESLNLNFKTLPSKANFPTNTFKVTANRLTNVTVTTIHLAIDDVHGIISFEAQVSKTGLTRKEPNSFKIQLSGFETLKMYKQKILNGIDNQTIISKLGVTPDSNLWADEVAQPHDVNTTIEDVNVNFHIILWEPNPTIGRIIADVAISSGTLYAHNSPTTVILDGYKTSTSLNWTSVQVSGLLDDSAEYSSLCKIDKNTLLIGTKNKGFFKVDISNPNWVWTHLSPPELTLDSSNNSSIILVNSTTLFVSTYDKGFFEVYMSKSSDWIWIHISTAGLDLNSARNACLAKISNDTLFVGTYDKGFYEVHVSLPNWVWTKLKAPGLTLNSGNSATIQKINSSTLLIGTYDKGFYKININDIQNDWIRVSPLNTDFSNLSGRYSSILQIDATHLLIGTYDAGFYKVNISSSIQWFWTKENSLLPLNEGQNSAIGKIDRHNLLVGTHDKGFYRINTTANNWVWTKINNSVVGVTDNSSRNSLIINLDRNNSLLIGTSDKGFYNVHFS